MKTHHKTAAVLLHYPTTSRTGAVTHTSVTNLDIHDIARSCRTYEIDHYYIVTPILEQHALVARIIGHWHQGASKEWHPDRFEALSRVQVVENFEAVKTDLNSRYPKAALEVAMPDARPLPNQLSYDQIRQKWQDEAASGVKIVVFGTGWGVAPEFYPEVHTYLAPIYGPLGKNGYNHLSVRAAVAIILDRLFGIN
jgi:hypothetical protein